MRRPAADDPPPVRTSAQRLEALVFEYRELTRTGKDIWRRRCEILLQIQRDELWRGAGDQDFDGWCWRVLRLQRPTVTKMLGIGRGPIGGEGRRHPGRSAASRARAQGPAQEEEVEPYGISLNLDDGQSMAAEGRGALGWAARQLGQIERCGTAGWRAALTVRERAEARREFVRLSDLFARCARAAAGDPEETPTEETPR